MANCENNYFNYGRSNSVIMKHTPIPAGHFETSHISGPLYWPVIQNIVDLWASIPAFRSEIVNL